MQSKVKELKDTFSRQTTELALLTKAGISVIILIIIDLTFGGSIRQNLPGWQIGLLVFFIVCAVVFQIAHIKNRSFSRLWYLAALNAAATFGLTAIAMPASPFNVYLVIVIFQNRREFGKRAGQISVTVYLFLLLGLNGLITGYDSQEYLGQLVNYIVLLVASLVMYSYLDGYITIANQQNDQIIDKITETEDERARLATLVNSINDAVVACDHDFMVIVSNDKAEQLIDADLTLVGRQLDDVLTIVDSDNVRLKLQSIVNPALKTSTFGNYFLAYSESDKINVYISVTKVAGHDESSDGYVIVLRDITRLKSLEQERDEFISIMSHELRTPVAVVEGAVSLAKSLNGKADPQKVDGFLTRAHDQIMMLAEIVNSLSVLVGQDINGQAVEIGEVNLSEVVKRVADTYSQSANEKGLELNIATMPSVPLVYSSEESLHEIIQNLVSNSIKYTKQGSVTIGIEQFGEDFNVVVKDTGIGISKADQERVFEKFWRSEDFETRESGGTGLGLYLVKKLADSIGVKVSVESEKGKGSIFTVCIPHVNKRLVQ